MSIALILIGAAVSCTGIWLIYPPAAIIAGGLVLSTVGIVLAYGSAER